MGVPKFFRYISERYPCLSELVRENQVPEFDNLYLDMNGIIHNCSHPNDDDVHFRITEEQIFKDIFFYLEFLFNMIKPQKLFFLAVDGVAPRAKMNQQRGRRFRSAKEAELQEEKARKKGEKLPQEARFDSNCITPGTPFMCRLDMALRYFIQHKISTSKNWRNCTVILSGHQTPGEGEHKIMEYIRYLKASGNYDVNSRHCLYGLDADLIMLGLCTHERHFSLLREEVKFGRKSNKAVGVSSQRFFLLHLSLMREYLEQEFIVLKDKMKIPFDIEKIIDDWVFMGFLVGNDFIPNIPNLHINTNALPTLYEAYIKVMPTLDGYINEGGNLNLSRLQAYIECLSEFDRDYFAAHYEDFKFLESKRQFDIRNEDTFGGNQDLMALIKATDFEFDYSPDADVVAGESDSEEHSDNDQDFEKEFYQHRRDYYVNKMKYEEMTPEVLAEQTQCYIEALQWTLSYYYHGVQSWNWYYPHHYAPFISDLKNFKNLKVNFDLSKPFLPFQQLMSVLPAGSRDHVPEAYKKLMTSPESPVIDFYPQNFDTDLNGKKQEWEAVVLIPFIEEKRLLKALEPLERELTPYEKERNIHGPMYVYTYSSTSQGQLQGPLSFPSIGNLFCREKKLFRDEVQVRKENLVLGPMQGALKNIYFCGFPTFKHLEYTSELRRQGVNVFDQPSRDNNMIIFVQNQEFGKSLDELTNSLLGKTVFVGWPHMMEARVVRISDNERSYDGKTYDKTDAQRWKMDTQAIRDHHNNRMGIDVGEIQFIVHVQRVSGEEFRLDQKSKVFKAVKTYDQQELCYPYQCIVTDVKAYRKRFGEELPFAEAFKVGTEIFMLTNPYYGAIGEVTEADCFEKNGRIKVMLTVPQEPSLANAEEQHDKCNGSYMPAYQAASLINISDNVFNRITGTVLVISGLRRDVSNQEISRTNVGLQLKFPKQNEEVAGYTKKERSWLYSERAVSVVQQYYCKYPVVFEVLAKRSGQNENLFESDLFCETDGDESLSGLKKFLSQLPSQKAHRVQAGTESLDNEVIEIVKKQVAKVKDAPLKKITIQVKPHLLYAPKLCLSASKAPDKNADFRILDRVVLVKDCDIFTVGMKATVIKIVKVKDLNPVRQECINKEDTYCEVLFDLNNEIARLHTDKFINLSYGMTMNPVKAPIDKKQIEEIKQPESEKIPMLTESFASILQRQAKSSVPTTDNHKNFTKVWNQMKTLPGEEINVEPPKNSQESKKDNTKRHVNGQSEMFSNAVLVAPPTSLPKPPAEWLQITGKCSEKTKPVDEDQTSFDAMKFFQTFKELNMNENRTNKKENNFMGNPNFPNSLKQPKPNNQQVNRQEAHTYPNNAGPVPFFKNNTSQFPPLQSNHHNQQNRNFPRNRNGPQQPFIQPNNLNDFQMRHPMQLQPRNIPVPKFAQFMHPQPPMPMPLFMNPQWQHPPMMMSMPMPPMPQFIPAELPKPQTPATQQIANPFVPLQASRKATKGKNDDSSQKQEPTTDANDKIEAKESNFKTDEQVAVTSTSAVTPSIDKPEKSKTPNIDTRKSRLAINFSAN